MTRFAGQRVLVVGASSGIGLATARAFAAAGAQVVMASRSMDKLQQAAATVGAGVSCVTLDVTDDAAVQAYFAQAGQWDHVVVTASQAPGGPSRTLPLEQAYQAMHSKFWGAYRVARQVDIRAGGSLTLVSGRHQRPRANSVLQGAINAALDALAKGLALELAPVRVNSVSPGIIDTPLWNRMTAADKQAMFDDTAQRLPVGRIGAADDLADAILFLAGNGFTTATTVMVDGGASVA